MFVDKDHAFPCFTYCLLHVYIVYIAEINYLVCVANVAMSGPCSNWSFLFLANTVLLDLQICQSIPSA